MFGAVPDAGFLNLSRWHDVLFMGLLGVTVIPLVHIARFLGEESVNEWCVKTKSDDKGFIFFLSVIVTVFVIAICLAILQTWSVPIWVCLLSSAMVMAIFGGFTKKHAFMSLLVSTSSTFLFLSLTHAGVVLLTVFSCMILMILFQSIRQCVSALRQKPSDDLGSAGDEQGVATRSRCGAYFFAEDKR